MMFCEAACKYTIETKNLTPHSIGDIYAVAEDMPEQTSAFLCTQNGKFCKFVYSQEGMTYSGLLGYRDGTYACVFRLVRANNKDKAAIILNNERYRIRRYYSRYPTTKFEINDEKLTGECKLPDKSIKEVISTLNLSDKEIELKDGIFRNKIEDSKCYDPLTKYCIKAKDGTIQVDANLLIVNEPIAINQPLSICVSELKERAREEFSNSEDYIHIVRNYVKDLRLFGHSFIEHALLKNQHTLFFTFFVVHLDETTEIVVLMTRQLFAMVGLFNHINNYAKLINIPYFYKSKCEIIDGTTKLINKYKLKPGRIRKIVSIVGSGQNIVLSGTKSAFWILVYAMEVLSPLEFPGLIALPIKKELAYLLAGPYHFIASLDDSSILGSLVSLNFKEYVADEFMAVNGKSLEHSEISIPHFGDADKKKKYLRGLLHQRLDTEIRFPLSPFKRSNLVEQYFIEMPFYHKFTSVYEINTCRILFPPVYLYDEDPLPLWLIIFTGSIDYDILLQERWSWDIYGYMVRRACIDRDQANLSKILKYLEMNKIACRDDIARHMTNYPPKLEIDKIIAKYDNFCICKVVNACECFAHNNLESSSKVNLELSGEITKKDKNDEIELVYDNQICGKTDCAKRTILIANNKIYQLISVESILGAYDSNNFNEELILNMLVYMRAYNLPILDNAELITTKYQFQVD